MKRLIFLVVSLLAISLVISQPAQANSSSTASKIVVLNPEEVINHDYFAVGDIVEIYGTVNGDVYAAGGQITINGTVNGDVIALGGQINLGGTISQNARIAGGQIDVRSNIGRNLSIGAGNVKIDPNAQLNGNLVIAAGNVEVNAPVAGDLTIGAGNVTITNQIGGNVTAGVGTMRLTDQASVVGDINYYSEQELSRSESATISGAVTQHLPQDFAAMDNLDQSEIIKAGDQVKEAFSSIITFIRIISLITQVILGLILVNFFPNFTLRTTNFIEKEPWKSLVVGIVAIIIVPIISLILFVTVIGIPLAALTLIFYFILAYFARIFFVYWLGARFLLGLKRKANKSITYLVGAGIFFVLTSIAIIGPITTILATFFGLGALLLANQKTYQSARKLKIF